MIMHSSFMPHAPFRSAIRSKRNAGPLARISDKSNPKGGRQCPTFVTA